MAAIWRLTFFSSASNSINGIRHWNRQREEFSARLVTWTCIVLKIKVNTRNGKSSSSSPIQSNDGMLKSLAFMLYHRLSLIMDVKHGNDTQLISTESIAFTMVIEYIRALNRVYVENGKLKAQPLLRQKQWYTKCAHGDNTFLRRAK